jgi:hypothetical protein
MSCRFQLEVLSMSLRALALTISLTLAGSSAQAADCGAVLDELTRAVSGNLTMSGDKKAAMLRMATSGYDHCMSGDTKHSGNVRDMIMTQIKESLGGR